MRIPDAGCSRFKGIQRRGSVVGLLGTFYTKHARFENGRQTTWMLISGGVETKFRFGKHRHETGKTNPCTKTC